MIDSGVVGLPAEKSRRAARLIWIVAPFVGLCVAVLAVALYWPRTTVVEVLRQPAGVTYADGSAHVVVLTHVRAPMAAVPLLGSAAADRYQVVLGRDPSGGYGHLVRLEATGTDPSQVAAEWTAEGVWLNYPTGHRLFVPAERFTGGR